MGFDALKANDQGYQVARCSRTTRVVLILEWYQFSRHRYEKMVCLGCEELTEAATDLTLIQSGVDLSAATLPATPMSNTALPIACAHYWSSHVDLLALVAALVYRICRT